MIAYEGIGMARVFVMFQQDPKRREAAEKAYEKLIKKYDLTDRLEFTDQEDQKPTLAKRAFEDVDLTAFISDVAKFSKSHNPSTDLKDGDEDELGFIKMDNLKIVGDQATATIHSSYGTEERVVFVRSGGGWFLSLLKTQEASLRPDVQIGERERTDAGAADDKLAGVVRAMKQLAGSFFDFDTDFGSLPSDEMAAEVKETTGTDLILTGANVLNQLTAHGEDHGMEILRAPGGDGGWRYFPGLSYFPGRNTSDDDPQTPVLISPVFDGACAVLWLDASVTKSASDEREALLKSHPGSISLAATDSKGAGE